MRPRVVARRSLNRGMRRSTLRSKCRRRLPHLPHRLRTSSRRRPRSLRSAPCRRACSRDASTRERRWTAARCHLRRRSSGPSSIPCVRRMPLHSSLGRRSPRRSECRRRIRTEGWRRTWQEDRQRRRLPNRCSRYRMPSTPRRRSPARPRDRRPTREHFSCKRAEQPPCPVGGSIRRKNCPGPRVSPCQSRPSEHASEGLTRATLLDRRRPEGMPITVTTTHFPRKTQCRCMAYIVL